MLANRSITPARRYGFDRDAKRVVASKAATCSAATKSNRTTGNSTCEPGASNVLSQLSGIHESRQKAFLSGHSMSRPGRIRWRPRRYGNPAPKPISDKAALALATLFMVCGTRNRSQPLVFSLIRENQKFLISVSNASEGSTCRSSNTRPLMPGPAQMYVEVKLPELDDLSGEYLSALTCRYGWVPSMLPWPK